MPYLIRLYRLYFTTYDDDDDDDDDDETGLTVVDVRQGESHRDIAVT